MRVRLCVIATLVCAECIAIGTSVGQAGTTGGIQGFVSDVGFHPLAGVSVSAVSPSDRATASTQADGFYSLVGLPLDTYTLTFSKEGYVSHAIAGVATIQDSSVRVNAKLAFDIKVLAQVQVRSVTSLVQPTVTADTYVVSQQRLSDINGTPQDLGATPGHAIGAAFDSLPGVTADTFGIPTIRAGAINDVGFQIEGVDNTDPITGFSANPVSFNGVRSVQLSTGGYDVSEGKANSGVINEVVKRGTYPTQGRATTRVNGPLFGHELSFDFGGATPTNRFSYYFSFGGASDADGFGNGSTLLPLALDDNIFGTLNDDVLNLFYHFGRDNSDELQFFTDLSAFTVTSGYLVDPAIAPYAANNGIVQASNDRFGLGKFPTFASSYITLFPGQAAQQQNINAFDTWTNNIALGKINFKHQFTSSSFLEARVTRTMANEVVSSPFGGGAFNDFYSNLQTTGTGVASDYTNQITSRNEVSGGAGGTYYSNEYVATTPSVEPFLEPLESLGCAAAANALGAQQAGGCYIAPFNAALNTALGLGLATDPAHAPLTSFFGNFFHANSPVHQWYAYAKDRWQPDQHLTVTFGLRWDKEAIGLPADVAKQNTSYYIDNTAPTGCGPPPAVPCNIVTIPGQPIGNDVTQPQRMSPRFAASYQLTEHDVVRFSYGKNIEFVPTSSIEGTSSVPSALQACNIASGCFTPLPGYGATNHVTNLYQQILIDVTTSAGQQYTPVLPQTAVNLDFSYEHEFGAGIEMRLTPYYRKGTNYAVFTAPLLFVLKSGTPVFGASRLQNGGINENTGVEFALQRSAQYGLSGLLDATYDSTLANYNSDVIPFVNPAALAAGHFYHVTYVAPLEATLNLVYDTRPGLNTSMTLSYESGYRYGVGKKTFVFGPNGLPLQVLNTDQTSGCGPSCAYYLTNSSNPGTELAPNIVASRGTPEGDDPGTLFSPAIATVNLTLSYRLGRSKGAEVGIRAENLFGDYSPTRIPPNPYYGFSGFGNNGLPSGANGNACVPGQTFGCEPFQYNLSPLPYEKEQIGPPRVYTLFLSMKY